MIKEKAIITYRKTQLKDIKLEQLMPGIYQPRRAASKEALISLAQTIGQLGVLEPLIVRPIGGKVNCYEIIAGERRWRAAKLAGLATVPCMLSDYSDEDAAQIALIENVAREDLNPISKAKAMRRLIEEFGYTHEKVGDILGISREGVTNQLRLLKLDARLQVWLGDNGLSEGHGKLLAGAPIEEQYALGYESLRQGWTTRTLEIAIKRLKGKSSFRVVKRTAKAAEIVEMEGKLAEKFGCTVKIKLKKDETGNLRIDFGSVGEMQELVKKLGR